MIKLVAIETALVGWLSYWLFLVYAENPSVAQALSEKLSRFPQLSFTTIDISVLIVIGVLSLLLALKFQRGLKPGIRLERALQMLETLMKRNLFLESQVAELKLERGNGQQPQTQIPTLSSAATTSEPEAPSWEKAFRIPIEAGPMPPQMPGKPLAAKPPAATVRSPLLDRHSFSRPITTPKQDIKPIVSPLTSPKQPSSVSERQGKPVMPSADSSLDEKTKTMGSDAAPTSWEDSPRRIVEASGILNPPSDSRSPVSILPDSSPISQPPSPQTQSKITIQPAGPIIGPTATSRSEKNPFRRMLQLPPTTKIGPASVAPHTTTPTNSSSPTAPTAEVADKPKPESEAKTTTDEDTDSKPSSFETTRPEGKPRPTFKKRFSFEKDEERRRSSSAM